MKKIIELIKSPLKIFIFLNNRNILRLSDKTYLKIRYRASMHKKLNLDNPQTYCEKLQWLKLYDRNPKYKQLVDKYEVREYITKTIGEEYLIPLIGVYNSFDEINFKNLPKQFVMKCNHDSGSVIICNDKEKFDINKAQKKITKALKTDFFYNGREWPYKGINPKIIIEKYLSETPNEQIKDYKIYMFNGKLGYFSICSEREKKLKITFFDNNRKLIELRQEGYENDKKIKLPKNYNKMVSLAEKLSKGIPQVRVDFYEVKDKIYFGEMTFFDGSGFFHFVPEKYDYIWGKKIELPSRKESNENKESNI